MGVKECGSGIYAYEHPPPQTHQPNQPANQLTIYPPSTQRPPPFHTNPPKKQADYRKQFSDAFAMSFGQRFPKVLHWLCVFNFFFGLLDLHDSSTSPFRPFLCYSIWRVRHPTPSHTPSSHQNNRRANASITTSTPPPSPSSPGRSACLSTCRWPLAGAPGRRPSRS